MFSLYLSDDVNFQKSRVWFGGYDHSFLRTFEAFKDLTDDTIDKKIVWAPLTNKARNWKINLEGVNIINKEQEKILISLGAKKAVFDSSTTHNLMPKQEYDLFSGYLKKLSKSKCWEKAGPDLYPSLYCKCAPVNLKDFPTLHFKLRNGP